MNVRGERILIFGDSLSHHGADNAPEIWDVDTGSARNSGQPGDLLASMLAEQGAAAVRVNARVGRSAHNFWGREDTSSLLASDQAFAPTKVIVMLGTNDIGLNLDIDGAEMVQIRDFYKGLGAEVWGIGPFMYVSDTLNKQAMPVANMMSKTFGSRWIDPRDVTPLNGRAGDGVHFAPGSARELALALQQMVLTTSSPLPWKTIAIGVAMALGGALAYNYWKRGVVALPFGDLENDEYKPPEERLRELLLDPDPKSMDIAQDLAMEHGIKLSTWSSNEFAAPMTGSNDEGHFVIENPSPFFVSENEDEEEDRETRVVWHVDTNDEKYGYCRADFSTFVDGERVNWKDLPAAERDAIAKHARSWFLSAHQKYSGTKDYCIRAATADAWAIAKGLKELKAGPAHRIFGEAKLENARKVVERALDQDNSEPAELYGLDEGCNPNLSRDAFVRCTKRQQRALGAGSDDETEDRATFWYGMLKRKQDTVAALQEEIDDGKKTIARLAKKKAPAKNAPNHAYQNHCRAIEHQWNEIRGREQAIAKFTKKPDPNTPRPAACPEPMAFKFWDKDPEVSAEDRDFDQAWGDKSIPKPAGYDERKAAHDEHDREAKREYDEYKSRGFWGSAPEQRSMLAGDTDEKYRVVEVTSTNGHLPMIRVRDPNGFLSLERAEKLLRAYKRQARTVYIENSQGEFVPVKGAMKFSKSWSTFKLEGLQGLEAARRRPEQETKTTEDGPGLNPPRQGELHIGRDNLSYKDLPWSKVIAEAKKEAKSESSNKLHLSMHVKHAPNDHTPFAHVSWDPMDQKGAIAFAKKLIDDKGAMYSSVVAFAERPHDRSDRRPPKGHWTLASFEDDSIPDDR